MQEYEPVCGSAIRMSCSWCHKLNRLYKDRKNYCDCGHRSDVARVDCDCPECQPGEHRKLAADYEEQLEAALLRIRGKVLGGHATTKEGAA